MPPYQAFASVALSGVLLSGCASTHPLAHQGLASAPPQLAPNPKDKDGHVPFSYSGADPNWPGYHAAIVDVVVYAGRDQQFGGTSDADRARLAAYMQEAFSEALKSKFDLVSAPESGALRIHLTLPRNAPPKEGSEGPRRRMPHATEGVVRSVACGSIVAEVAPLH
jgi:hypothetical protein